MDSNLSIKPEICNFVILFDGRVGSTHLVSTLNQHSNILCYHEIFADNKHEERHSFQSFLNRDSVLSKTWLDAMNSIDPFLSNSEKIGAFGFKVKISDIIGLDDFADFLVTNNFKVIHLYRRNIIKSLVSTFNGLKLSNKNNGHWNIHSSESTSLGQITIDPLEFNKWFFGRVLCERVTQDFVQDLPLDVLRLSYEDLFSEHQVSIKRVLNFLGFENSNLKGNFKKITSDDLSKAVSNLTEIKALFPKEHPQLKFFRKYFE